MDESDTDPLIHAGKHASQLTHDEAIRCAIHFHAEHVSAVMRMADMARRMTKLEEALPKDLVSKLDRWLRVHPRDALRGEEVIEPGRYLIEHRRRVGHARASLAHSEAR